MKASDLLEQMLRAGTRASSGTAASGGLGGLLGSLVSGGVARAPQGQNGLDGLGGLLGGLLGSGGAAPAGKGRAGGMNLSGLATLGMLAYQAYSAWQRQQGQAAAREPQTVNRLMGDEVEEHSQAILRAMIAAAKADGRIDAAERQLIEAEIARLSDDPQLQAWLEREVQGPLDPAQVATASRTPEMAAEMYLASLLVAGADGSERAYLEELARHLEIDPALRRELEAQVPRGHG